MVKPAWQNAWHAEADGETDGSSSLKGWLLQLVGNPCCCPDGGTTSGLGFLTRIVRWKAEGQVGYGITILDIDYPKTTNKKQHSHSCGRVIANRKGAPLGSIPAFVVLALPSVAISGGLVPCRGGHLLEVPNLTTKISKILLCMLGIAPSWRHSVSPFLLNGPPAQSSFHTSYSGKVKKVRVSSPLVTCAKNPEPTWFEIRVSFSHHLAD